MRYLQFFSIVLVLFICCQTNTKTKHIDLTAAKNEINTQLDNMYSALKDKDIDALRTMLTDDGLFCGTDPGEFWSKEELLKITEQLFANESSKFDFSIHKRVIRVDADGNSATVIEQFYIHSLSKYILIRYIHHLVKIENDWKIDFHSVSLIPQNADLEKLDKALE